MSRRLLEGSRAIAESAVLAGCSFFAGYPMTPFTEVLESFAALRPEAGGVCINAESELEAVGMAWGALSTGAPGRSEEMMLTVSRPPNMRSSVAS